MSEIEFLKIQQGDVIIIINKHAKYEVGRITEKDGKFLVPNDVKPYIHLCDAMEVLIRNASRV